MPEIDKLQDPSNNPAPTAATTSARPVTPRTPKKRAVSGTRRASLGDTTGAKTTAGISRRAVRASLDAAQGSQQNAVKDILTHATDKAEALRTLLAGSSQDDIDAVRQMLLGTQINPNGPAT